MTINSEEFEALFQNALSKQKIMAGGEKAADGSGTREDTLVNMDEIPSNFIYPTLIVIPLIITTVVIFTLNISIFAKIFTIILILFSIGCYISQIKKLNIALMFNNISSNLPLKKN
ncbi:KN57gp_062 [Dikerogammarus haemobaphes nudivirus]|nr:KN57gp_062 [Dikerogammarus haemobaphes nudivirus]